LIKELLFEDVGSKKDIYTDANLSIKRAKQAVAEMQKDTIYNYNSIVQKVNRDSMNKILQGYYVKIDEHKAIYNKYLDEEYKMGSAFFTIQ